jgi:hypothetical protein
MEYTRKRIINKQNLEIKEIRKEVGSMFMMDKQIVRFMNQIRDSRLVQFINSPTSIVKFIEK